MVALTASSFCATGSRIAMIVLMKFMKTVWLTTVVEVSTRSYNLQCCGGYFLIFFLLQITLAAATSLGNVFSIEAFATEFRTVPTVSTRKNLAVYQICGEIGSSTPVLK